MVSLSLTSTCRSGRFTRSLERVGSPPPAARSQQSPCHTFSVRSLALHLGCLLHCGILQASGAPRLILGGQHPSQDRVLEEREAAKRRPTRERNQVMFDRFSWVKLAFASHCLGITLCSTIAAACKRHCATEQTEGEGNGSQRQLGCLISQSRQSNRTTALSTMRRHFPPSRPGSAIKVGAAEGRGADAMRRGAQRGPVLSNFQS